MKLKRTWKIRFSFFMVLAVAVSLFAQTQASQKVLTLADYTRWKHITSTAISPDGNWVSFAYRPNGGDETLFFKNVTNDMVHEIAVGSRPAFSRDSRWAAYIIGLPKAEAEKLRKEKKPVPSKAELLNLTTGEKFTVENASSFVFSNDSKFFAAKKAKQDAEAKPGGTDLILRNLGTGSVFNIGNVGEFSFSRPGIKLAYTVDAADKKGNGLYLMDLEVGTLKALDAAEADYSAPTWDKDGVALAVLRGMKKKELAQRDNVLLAFIENPKTGLQRIEYDPARDSQFPKDMVLSEKGNPEMRREGDETVERRALFWGEDRSRIFCGIKEQEKELEPSKEPVADVDVWHWKDERIQSEQARRAENDRNFTYRSVYIVSNRRFLRLADGKMRTVAVTQNGLWGIGRDDKPYLSDVETRQADYYLVNTGTGERKMMAQGIRHPIGDSPDSRHFLFLKDGLLWISRFEDGKTLNISEKAGASFFDADDDHPDEKPPYGIAGWTLDGKTLIVNHKYDLWMLPLDGSVPKNITMGAGDRNEIRFRYVSFDRGERSIDATKPLLLSAYGEWTKKAGFYSLKIGSEPHMLVFEDRAFGMPLKARSADKYLFTRESFVEFPDFYVSGPDFANPKKITDANPQQSEYAWGNRVLIDYANSRGQKLQATLTLPAGYEKGKRYPMVVYFYEKMSQQHHRYSMPTYDDRPHMSAYASDGYLVLQPDIVYVIGRPGSSALDCVTSAIKKVIELGYADPQHIGLQGHSWGGYEAGFIATQTDMFACIVSGAGPSSILVEFNQIFKGSGNNNNSYYERSQGRMGTNPWKDPELFISQSAIQQATKITTPLLLLHGTEDGSVDWIESLEYYNAARRLGKNIIFLSYPGEPHHLAKEENQKDFLTRMKQYFDHYLKESLAPDWMENGVPFLKKKK
jgi:dipeptidyl aminopeptidase/acylaminoacyl peptidase